jgi:acetyl esterase
MIAHQTLIYPLMAPNHLRNIASDLPFASYAIYGLGGTIERPTIEWLWNQYLTNPKDSFNPYACPYRADDLAGLPPATVLLAGADPLRDEGKNYADRLADAGVPVAIHEYPGMFHGALWMAGLYDDSRRMFADIGDEVRPRLGSQAADVNPRQA